MKTFIVVIMIALIRGWIEMMVKNKKEKNKIKGVEKNSVKHPAEFELRW